MLPAVGSCGSTGCPVRHERSCKHPRSGKSKQKAATIAEKVIESAANIPGVTAEIAKKIYEEAASKVVKGVDESGKVSGSEMQELAKETAGKATAIMQTAKASLEAAAGVTLSEDDLQSAISGLQTLVNNGY